MLRTEDAETARLAQVADDSQVAPARVSRASRTGDALPECVPVSVSLELLPRLENVPGHLEPLEAERFLWTRAKVGVEGEVTTTVRPAHLPPRGIKAVVGRERVTPLAYWRVDDTSVAVLASNRAARKHPDWYHNLVANRDAKTEIGTETFLARARVAAPNERSKLLRRIAEQTPSVSAALNRTAREIPLVILDLRTDDIRRPRGR
jgi:deazaflavin-dependent oxidoreductase (nitroreductase family)